MNSTKINSVQFNTDSTINPVHNLNKKLPILNSCLICTKLIKNTSAHKSAQFRDNFKTFCEFFSLNEINCYDFLNKFRTSSLCDRCKERIIQIAKVVRDVNRLNKQLDTLRNSFCSDLTRVNGLLASSVLEDVDQDLKTLNSSHNKSNQENQCEIILQQKFRKLLEEKLNIPISSRSLAHSTQETSDEHRDSHNISSLNHPISVESHDDYVNTNKEVPEAITETIFPSSSNSLNPPIIEFQGADAINTESDDAFPEICPTSLHTITDSCNDFDGFDSRDDMNDFEEDDIKIEENEDVSIDFETTAVDEIRTNSATYIKFDLNRNHSDRNDTRDGNKIQKSKNESEPIDIAVQPPAEPPIKLKNAVVILTRLSPRSVGKLSRSNVSNVNHVKTGGIALVSINTENHTCSSNLNSDQDTSTVLNLNKPSKNELNSDVELVTWSLELSSSPLQEASTAGIEVEVEHFSELLNADDHDNIVEVEVATETDTTMQDICVPPLLPKETPAPSDKLVLKYECPFIDPIRGTCPKRGRRFIDQLRLDAHLNRKHYGKKKHHEFQCKQCHIGVESFKRLIEHEKIHSGVKDMICRTCAEPFRTEKLLLFHQRKVHGELYPFLCHVCSKGFNFSCHLRTHMLSAHEGEFRFRCEECNAGFYYQSALNNHILIHATERQFVCECCSKKFTTKGNLTKHMTTHVEDKSWLCDTCGKSFRSRDDLKNHWEVHRTDKSYACQMCDFKTKTKASLGNHSRRHYKNRKKTTNIC